MSEVQLTIHRSAHEIGGNCVEIAFGEHRLLLDAGRPLDSPTAAHAEVLLPKSLDLSRPIDGLLISHPHQDHYGLLEALPKSWPVWTGPGSAALIHLTTLVTRQSSCRPLSTWKAWKAFEIGPFRVTPYLIDHSAVDAYMLLIEVGGRKILYTGDFRLHGRKRAVMERLLSSPPKGVHTLVMEGTNLGADKPCLTEHDLEDRFIELFRRTSGRVFVTWSAQNIDRTVTLVRACKRTGRQLAIDLYTADVLASLHDAIGECAPGIPTPHFPEIRVIVTTRMRDHYRSIGRGDHVERMLSTGQAISARHLATDARRWVVMARRSLIHDYRLKDVQPNERDAWSYSMWRGYLQQPDGAALSAWFKAGGANVCHLHTTGHATPSDLRTFAESIAAERIIPIHGNAWAQYAKNFPACVPIADGLTVTV